MRVGSLPVLARLAVALKAGAHRAVLIIKFGWTQNRESKDHGQGLQGSLSEVRKRCSGTESKYTR